MLVYLESDFRRVPHPIKWQLALHYSAAVSLKTATKSCWLHKQGFGVHGHGRRPNTLGPVDIQTIRHCTLIVLRRNLAEDVGHLNIATITSKSREPEYQYRRRVSMRDDEFEVAQHQDELGVRSFCTFNLNPLRLEHIRRTKQNGMLEPRSLSFKSFPGGGGHLQFQTLVPSPDRSPSLGTGKSFLTSMSPD